MWRSRPHALGLESDWAQKLKTPLYEGSFDQLYVGDSTVAVRGVINCELTGKSALTERKDKHRRNTEKQQTLQSDITLHRFLHFVSFVFVLAVSAYFLLFTALSLSCTEHCIEEADPDCPQTLEAELRCSLWAS